MDDISRRPQLPALNYLDLKKEPVEENPRASSGHGTSQGLSTRASPLYHHSQAPPYSHVPSIAPPAHTTSGWNDYRPPNHLSQESNRLGENDTQDIKQTRQSLPSISEALGVESQTCVRPAAPSQPAHLPQTSPIGTLSISPSLRRSYPMDPPQAHSISRLVSDFPQSQQRRTDNPSERVPLPPSLEAPDSFVSNRPEKEEHATQVPPPSPPRLMPTLTFPRTSERSPPSEQLGLATSMAPARTFPYGYTSYPPQYSNTGPPTRLSSGPIYQPSIKYGPDSASGKWKSEGSIRYGERTTKPTNYADNVKRHLDLYDVESALNEISASSGILSDFSRRYGDQMHHNQRSGATLSALPGLVEVDDMVAKTRAQQESLMKIRDVVLSEQAAYQQHTADQRYHHKIPDDVAMSQAENGLSEPEELRSGGYSSIDTKKRRGRAAPPGRCHSCNRAETPEWRRGPDGARTLCNACGLHYAKLTRKNNAGNKNNTLGSSSLRPKGQLPQ